MQAIKNNRLLDAMFAHPRGLAGRLGGMIMARSTGERNNWIIAQMEIQAEDRILEVGFGPGAALRVLADQARAGEVTGVENSPLMLRQAAKRNARAMREGRVRLLQGIAQALPFEEAIFNKVLAINSVQIWPDSLAGVKEMRRVLVPGGLIALALQPVWAQTDAEVKQIGTDLVALLDRAGFQQTHLEFKAMKPKSTVCALGVK